VSLVAETYAKVVARVRGLRAALGSRPPSYREPASGSLTPDS